MGYFFKTLWKYWRSFGEFMGNIIGRVFLMIFYLTLAAPFGIIARINGDPLKVKPPFEPKWEERKEADKSLEGGYNQGLT